MNVLIVEDEMMAQANLARALTQHFPDVRIVGSVRETVLWLRTPGNSADVIFMDVELSDGDCFEIFRQTDVTARVIMTTAYDNYAVRAFEVNSIDYLLKPIDLAALRRAVERCRVRSGLVGKEPAAAAPVEKKKGFFDRRPRVPTPDQVLAAAAAQVRQPEPQPAPAPAPVTEPVPQPAAPAVPPEPDLPEPEENPTPSFLREPEPAPAPTGAFDWQALCAYMEHELPIGLYNLLLDPLQAAGELANGTLTLHLNKAPAYPMFNKPDIAEKFRLAIQTLTGQNVHVVMQPMDTVTQINQRKIEELAHFPNVTIR